MSSSEDFTGWARDRFRESGGFTALIVLLRIGATTVTPVASSYLHVIGDELVWLDVAELLHKSGRPWDGVAFFVETGAEGGPIPDAIARERLTVRAAEVVADRLSLNGAGLFDRSGRAFRVDPA